MKKLFIASLLCSLSLSVCAADYSIKPKVTELTPPPTRVLLVGNSFMYYNCGVNGYISGLSKSLGIKISTTMATIGEIIIATNIGKCDAGVAVKGPIITFIPLNITGIIIASAISNAA